MRSLLRAGNGLVTVAVVALACGSSGCKPMAKSCPMASMNDSALIAHAAVVRLDVYGDKAHCRGTTIAPGAPPPAQSETVTAGKPLTLDVAAGHHALLLSAFRDVAATQLLGSACTETDVKANQPACFDLKLVEAPDGSVPIEFVYPDMTGAPPVDMATRPSTDMAQFIACSAAPDNCPADQYCAADGHCARGCKVDLDCAGTPSTPRCLVAAHQCVQCLGNGDCAPGKLCSPSNTCVDGCDPMAPSCPGAEMCCNALCSDTTGDVNNCGACGHACTLPGATSQCTGSQCAVKSCNVGFSDCNGAASDGCECPNPGDANHGCCPSGANAGKCEGGHADGLGDTFYDCYASGTYNLTTATDAALAFNKGGSVMPGNCTRNGTIEQVVCMQKGNDCVCFTYADNGGGSYVGRARKTSKPDSCTCAFGDTGDVLWN